MHIPNIFSFFALAKPKIVVLESIGSLDEWLSQWSAKPCTAVRIRQEPQKISKKIYRVSWMSGLVSGLQNHVRRFESARDLIKHLKDSVAIRATESFLILIFT